MENSKGLYFKRNQIAMNRYSVVLIILSSLIIIISLGGLLFYRFKPASKPLNLITYSESKDVNIKIFDPYIQGKLKSQIRGKIPVQNELYTVKKLASGEGYLYLYDMAKYYYHWTKDYESAIDIIWINADKIIDIDFNLKPPQKNQPEESIRRYTSSEPADIVLEVPAGFVRTNKISIKDIVQLIE